MYFTATKRASVANWWAAAVRKLAVQRSQEGWIRMWLHRNHAPRHCHLPRRVTHGQKHLLLPQPLSTMPEQRVHWQPTILTSLHVQNAPLAEHRNYCTGTSFSDVTYNSRSGSSLILPKALHHKIPHILLGLDFWRSIALCIVWWTHLIHLYPKRATLFSVVDTCPFHSSKRSFLSLLSSIRASLLCWNIHTGHIPFYISTIHSFSNLIVKYKRKLTNHCNLILNSYKFSVWNLSVASTETAHSPQLCGADFKVRI